MEHIGPALNFHLDLEHNNLYSPIYLQTKITNQASDQHNEVYCSDCRLRGLRVGIYGFRADARHAALVNSKCLTPCAAHAVSGWHRQHGGRQGVRSA